MRSLVPSCIAAVAVLLPGTALPAGTASADAVVASARQDEHSQQYAQAAALLRKAIEQEPARRPFLLREYADDLMRSGNATDAIPLYREILENGSLSAADADAVRRSLAQALVDVGQRAAAAEQYVLLVKNAPDDIDARLDYAQLLWDSGDLLGARAQYRAVISEQPRNAEAQQDFARLESWRQRYHESKQLVLNYLQQHKNDMQSRLTLGQDELWMGRSDEASATAESILKEQPDNAQAASLLAQTRERNVPFIESSYESARQSDNLLIDDARVAAGATPDQGRTRIATSFESLAYHATGEDADIIVQRPEISIERWLSDWVSVNSQVSWNGIRSPQDPTVSRTIGTYDLTVSASADDTLGFTVETRKEVFDNLLSLAQGISVNYNSFEAVLTPDDRMRGVLRLSRGIYSDGNRENLMEVAFDRRIFGTPSLTIGAAATQADFSEELGNGYFNPRAYRAIEATALTAGALSQRLNYDVSASLGTESMEPGGNATAYALNASLGYRIARAWSMRLYYDAYNTYQQSSNGFARHSAGVALTYKP